MSKKVAIIGTGLIGTSIGLALRKNQGDSLELVGHDRDPERSRKALKMGALDKFENSLPRAVQDAPVIILAVPIGAMPEVMKDASPSMVDDCIVTDTGSTKMQVIKWADEILPRSATFVGGHPMAGREVSGPEGASADLFKNAFYCICPSVTARPDAVKVVVGIAESVGAMPYFIDPDEHDSYVSFISHLPIIAASALVSSTNKSEGWREISRLVSTGYKDTTRLASGDPDMNRDICIYNREHLLNRIDDYIRELENWKELIRGDGVELGKLFARVWEARERVMKGVDMTQEARRFEKIPSTADMLMGTYAKTKIDQTIEKMKGRSSSSSADGKKR